MVMTISVKPEDQVPLLIAISDDLKARYVPLLKRINGPDFIAGAARVHRALEPFETLIEEEEAALLAAHPHRDQTPEAAKRFKEAETSWQADLNRRHPDLIEALQVMMEFHQGYNKTMATILHDFCTDGGTAEQFSALSAAVLSGVFTHPAA